MTVSQQPILYIPHGGGPLPLLGDDQHKGLTRFLLQIGTSLGKPSTILVISAHWEEKFPTITSGEHPELIYDYYGFPEESYQIKYPAPGSPHTSERLFQMLTEAGFDARQSPQRGFDHGLFVPLKLMFPEAAIPCLQLSLKRQLDPQTHINLGKAISKLRNEGVLIVGSGLSFHNMNALLAGSNPDLGLDFDRWLLEACTNPQFTPEQRQQKLIQWENAPQARYCHPRAEHLLPLHICFGAAQKGSPKADVIFHEKLMGHKVLGLIWK